MAKFNHQKKNKQKRNQQNNKKCDYRIIIGSSNTYVI